MDENYSDSEGILIEQGRGGMKTSDKIQIPRTNYTPQNTTKEEKYARIRAAWSCFRERKKYFKINNTPYL